MEFTDHFRLAKLEPGEGIHAGTGQYPQEDRDTLDDLLHQALTHRHARGADVHPAPAVTLHGGGALPAGATVRYRFTVLDQEEGESMASGEAVITTPSALVAPPAPTAAFDAGGQLPPGEYSYTLTRYAGDSTSETTVAQSVEVAIPSGPANGRVTLSLPDYGWGTTGFNVYRRKPGQAEYRHLGTEELASTFVDDGTLTESARTLPAENTTYADNAITVELPVTLESTQQWRLYRSLGTDYKDSFVGQFAHDVTEFVDTGQPASPVSLPSQLISPPSPRKVLLTGGAEVQGELPLEMLSTPEEGFEYLDGETLEELLFEIDVIAGNATGGSSALITGNGMDDTFVVQHNAGIYFQIEAWRVPGSAGGALLPVPIASLEHNAVRPDSILTVTFENTPADGDEVKLLMVRVAPPA